MQARNTPGRNYKGHFDFDGFFSAVDAERMAQNVSWRKISKDTGLSASSLTRLAQGKRLDIDGLIALSAWAGVDLESYYVNEKSRSKIPDTVKEVAALLRGDPNLDADDAKHLEALLRASYEHLRNSEGASRTEK